MIAVIMSVNVNMVMKENPLATSASHKVLQMTALITNTMKDNATTVMTDA